MDFFRMRVIESTFALVRKMLTNLLEKKENDIDSTTDMTTVTMYIRKGVLIAIMWGIGGSMNLASRVKFSQRLCSIVPSDIDLPNFTEL